MSLRLGLAQGLVPTNPAELTPDRASRIAALGVTTVVTHFQLPPAEVVGRRGEEIAAVLEQAGLGVAQCAGIKPDLVTADDAARRRSIAVLCDLMRSARSLGAGMIVTGCGSHHPHHPYGPARENHSPATRERLVASLRDLARFADDVGMLVALEPHVLTALDTPEHVRAILDEVDSPWIRSNFDPVNFLGSLEAVYDSGARVRHALATIGPRLAPSAHIKDLVLEPELVLHIAEAAPGLGIMDLAAVLKSCQELPDSSAVIVEHLDATQAPDAVRFVARLAAQLGISLR